MDKLVLNYIHLVATCLAIGIIITADLRLLAKLVGYRCMIRPPRKFETRVITTALFTLCISGAAMIAMGLSNTPTYLDNPKLVGKLLLVALLCANALFLHRVTFPWLTQAGPVSAWAPRHRLALAAPVALSNTLWLYCAFLGIARPWNNTRELWEVLFPAAVLWAIATLCIWAALYVAAREKPENAPDWIDSMKARLSDRVPLGGYQHSFEHSRGDSML